MFRKFVFASKEAYRNIWSNFKVTLLYFSLAFLNLLIIGYVFTMIININCLSEIISTRILLQPINPTFISTIPKINKIRIIHYFSFAFFLFSLIYLNKIFLKVYFDSYQNEIKLTIKLNGNRKMIKLPILYIAGFINGLASIFAWIFIKLFYSHFYSLLVEKKLGFLLLRMQYFNFTLLLFMLIFGLGSVFLITYYLFWRIYHF